MSDAVAALAAVLGEDLNVPGRTFDETSLGLSMLHGDPGELVAVIFRLCVALARLGDRITRLESGSWP
jgi:hypothetical protein